MKNEKFYQVMMEIYTELYKHTTPVADFMELYDSGETSKPYWFMQYYLCTDKQTEIINEICKKHKLSKQNTGYMTRNIILGSSPNSNPVIRK